MAAYTAPGWYGKLPSTGDFLHHRLSEQQISPWNHWFQQGLMHWHQQAWSYSANFLHAPVWNFVLPVTATRPHVQMGCLLPSCDRVGRAWPLLVLQSVPMKYWHPAQLAISGDWFQEVGSTMVQAVQQRHTAEWLEQALCGIAPLSLPDTGRSDIMDVIGYQDLPCTLDWREVATRFDPLQYTSYWWTNQSDGYPLASHKHSGNLTAQLFSQLFHPAAAAQPGRHGLYPPMFD